MAGYWLLSSGRSEGGGGVLLTGIRLDIEEMGRGRFGLIGF